MTFKFSDFCILSLFIDVIIACTFCIIVCYILINRLNTSKCKNNKNIDFPTEKQDVLESKESIPKGMYLGILWIIN